MNQKFKINKHAIIKPGYSIGDISINTPYKDIIEFLQKAYAYSTPNIEVNLRGYSGLEITFTDDGIIIDVDLLELKINSISAINNYLGNFNGIFIGSTFRELYSKYNDITLNNKRDYYLEIKSVEGILFHLPTLTESVESILDEYIDQIMIY